jgi:hypothetical protein
MSAPEASAATRERDSGLEENIHVAVRIRPLNPSDVVLEKTLRCQVLTICRVLCGACWRSGPLYQSWRWRSRRPSLQSRNVRLLICSVRSRHSDTSYAAAASRVVPSSTPRRGSGSPGEPGSGYSSPYSPGKLTKALRTYSFTFGNRSLVGVFSLCALLDHLFGPHVSTVDIYRRVTSSIVWSAMEGINGTVFA